MYQMNLAAHTGFEPVLVDLEATVLAINTNGSIH